MKLTSYMAITAHFAAYDENGNLVIRSRLIAFRALSGSHTGVNMGSTFLGILKDYNILHKVFTRLDLASIQFIQTFTDRRDNSG